MSLAIFSQLPEELKQYIFRYTHRPQPRRLLHDIQHFAESWDAIKTMYYNVWVTGWGETEEEAHHWINNDILRYVNEDHPTRVIFTEKYYSYWKRLVYTIKTDDDAADVHGRTWRNGNALSISKTMWALLRPHERCSFFSMFTGDPGSPIV